MSAKAQITSIFLAAAALLSAASPAFAQTTTTTVSSAGFALDRFDPAARGSDWFVLDGVDWQGELRPSIGITLDYAIHPLVIYNPDDSVRANLSSAQFYAHLGAALAIKDIFQLSLNVPIALVNSGDTGMIGAVTFNPPDSASIGDVRVGAAVRVYGKPEEKFRLGLGLDVYLPTGSRDQFTGDGNVRVLPHLMAGGDIDNFLYALRVGFLYRALDGNFNGSSLGHELQLAAAVGLRFADRKLTIGPELYLATVISDGNATFKETTTPAEALLGLHYTFDSGVRIGAGAALGLDRGLGTPAERLVATLEWSPPVEKDRDHDGILDKDDACPDVPGVRTDDPKTNGCPPRPDRDHDGVYDDEDACPDVPGVRTDDPKTNGCPPRPDRDGDGVYDDEDACPDVPGVRTDDPKTNGCPPPKDTDGDGITDDLDACPNEPGPADPDPKKNGCPLAHIDVVKHEIIILQQVKFAFDKSDILPESNDILEAVLKILNEHPEITMVHIEGHTDNKGSAKYNKSLSDRRAKAVMKWLLNQGIAKKRMTAKGYGLERPIDTNDTDEGRQNNRRVEFHIEGAQAEQR